MKKGICFHQNEKNTQVLMSVFYLLSLFIHTQSVDSILVFHAWKKPVTVKLSLKYITSYHVISRNRLLCYNKLTRWWQFSFTGIKGYILSVLLHVISKNKVYKTFAFVTVFVKIGQTTFAVCKNPEIHSPKSLLFSDS